MTTYTREQLLELADRHDLALKLNEADPGFHLSNEDMKMIMFALRIAADVVTPQSMMPLSSRVRPGEG